MSQEKVREILSHVDMTKIDLSSFKLSEKKFDELSHLYRNRVILSCVNVVVRKDQFSEEDVDAAFKLVKKVTNNPDLYTYAHIYTSERESVDDAINDITTNRNRSINDVKLKAIEKRIKDAYKTMRKTIELALENGNTFEEEFNEEIVEKCLLITTNAIENGMRKAAEVHAERVVEPESTDMPVVLECEKTPVEDVAECSKEVSKTKVSFWKRIFTKA